MKKIILSAVLGVSLLGAGASFAMHGGSQGKGRHSEQLCQKQQLSQANCVQVKSILKSYRTQMMPLKREARILRHQINGKIATQGSSWQEIEALVDKASVTHQQIFKLKSKARFEIFQKTGVLLPSKKHGSKKPMHKKVRFNRG